MLRYCPNVLVGHRTGYGRSASEYLEPIICARRDGNGVFEANVLRVRVETRIRYRLS
jgi:hypothetical protein